MEDSGMKIHMENPHLNVIMSSNGLWFHSIHPHIITTNREERKKDFKRNRVGCCIFSFLPSFLQQDTELCQSKVSPKKKKFIRDWYTIWENFSTKTTHSVQLSHAKLRWTQMNNRVDKKSAYPLDASSHTSKCKAKCIILISWETLWSLKLSLLLTMWCLGWDQSATTITEGVE